MESSDILILFVVAMNALFGMVGTGITAYANRNKTSAEAEQIKAEAEQAKAAATADFTGAISTLVGQVQKMADSLDKRDERLDRLERENREKDGKIEGLIKQVEELTKGGQEKDLEINDLKRQIENLRKSGESKDRQIVGLEAKVADLESQRQKDKAYQEKVETERQQLKEEVARLRERLEAKNGEKTVESPAEVAQPAGDGGAVPPAEG